MLLEVTESLLSAVDPIAVSPATSVDKTGTIIFFDSFDSRYLSQRLELPEDIASLAEPKVVSIQSRGGRFFNGEMLSLTSIYTSRDQVPILTFQPSSYRDLLATHRSLDELLPDGQTLRQRYGFLQYDETFYNLSPLSKAVGVSAVIITLDNKVLLSHRSSSVAVEPNSWHVSLAEGMELKDQSWDGSIDPRIAVVRAVDEELQDSDQPLDELNISPGNVQIMGLAISQKYLQPEFLARVFIPLTAEEIIRNATKAKDQWEHAEIKSVDNDPAVLRTLLEDLRWSPHGYLAIAAMISSDKANYALR